MADIKFASSSTIEPIADSTKIFLVEIDDDQLVVHGDPNPVNLIPDFSVKHLGLSATAPIVKVPTADGVLGFVLFSPDEENFDNRALGGNLARIFSASTHLQIFGSTVLNIEQVAEGLLLGAYNFNRYKSSKTESQISKVTFITNAKLDTKTVRRLKLLAKAVHDVRDLVNTPANDIYPQTVAAWASAAVKPVEGLSIEIWDEKRLAKEKCGGILAVGQGSVRPPRLVKISWSPKGAKTSLALVGKGITFDTGGLSLKPASSMVGMKYDMTGAATVINAVIAIAQLKLNVKVTAWACLAENMPSGSATRPNDVVRARNGKTIEIMNTDAEGRVVLADGLSLASEQKPDLIVDVATLTGAATVALGNRYAGLMGSDVAIDILEEAADTAGELVWHMPLPADLRSVLDSPIADIANAKIGNTAGGMLLGGLFLKEFVGNDRDGKQISWAHLDIAGPANNDKEPYGYTPKGGTGAIVRTLFHLAEHLADH